MKRRSGWLERGVAAPGRGLGRRKAWPPTRGSSTRLGALVAAVSGPAVLAPLAPGCWRLQAELADLARDARDRRRRVRGRPRAAGGGGGPPPVLTDLRRKYGDTLAEVMAFHDDQPAAASPSSRITIAPRPAWNGT